MLPVDADTRYQSCSRLFPAQAAASVPLEIGSDPAVTQAGPGVGRRRAGAILQDRPKMCPAASRRWHQQAGPRCLGPEESGGGLSPSVLEVQIGERCFQIAVELPGCG